ncbi:MAG: trimethylamine methyltransferase family protein [Caldilineaceae bacterium]|nr:trimethylamine methyltransferase family protein [Caldilineaceae bacterium]
MAHAPNRFRPRADNTAAASAAAAAVHLTPRLTLLDADACMRLHAASCQILERTGVRVYHVGALRLLAQAGAQVVDDLVRIPAELVDAALATAPRSFALHRRGADDVACLLDGEQVYFGPGSDTLRYLDPRSGARRDFQLADVADVLRVCDALPEIGFVMSVGIPRDVPTARYYRHQYAAMLRNTLKPSVFVCNDLADIEAIGAMAAAVAGGMEQLVAAPNLLLYSEPTTPLSHSLEAVDKLLYCARHRIPVTHSPAPMIGGTAPVTIAGAVALGNAELLSGLVMHQLTNPGAPFLYGHGTHHLDMKAMISVYGAPEFQLARLMAAGMGRFYKLPVWGYSAHSDSAVLDEQAAVDAQFSIQTALLAGTNLNHDVGYLEAGLANSPEYMVLANEIIAMNRAFTRGVQFDDEALALDVIDEVGPGGQFLSHDHTMRHWRELWVPTIFDRQRLESWQEKGSKTMHDRVREATVAIMDSHQVAPLPASVDAEIDYILRQE